MYIDKTEYEASEDLGLYIEAHLKPDNEINAVMLNSTQYETRQDLSLYLEALLNPDEFDVAIDDKVETKELNDVDVSETKKESFKLSPIPSWGQKTFKCLLVKSAGMSLVVPAMSVSYIERINEKIIRLPLEVDAFRGVVTSRNRSVAVIDLFNLISENTFIYNQQSMEVDTHHIEYVIVMENGDYALACDDVGEMITLTSEDVRWNRASFDNPMFAGIVTEHLCPIVNIENIQEQVAAMPFVQSLNNNY
jgi:chemotaxis signal transduction protein